MPQPSESASFGSRLSADGRAIFFAGWSYDLSPVSFKTGFIHNGERFPSALHYILSKKAELNHLPQVRQNIMSEPYGWKLNDCFKGKALNAVLWKREAPAIVREAYVNALASKPWLRKLIKECDGKDVFYCSYDAVLGTGSGLDESCVAREQDVDGWQPLGVNVVGRIVSELSIQL